MRMNRNRMKTMYKNQIKRYNVVERNERYKEKDNDREERKSAKKSIARIERLKTV